MKRTGADRFTDDGLPVEPCDCADAFEDVLARPPCCLCWLGRSFAPAAPSSTSLGRCSIFDSLASLARWSRAPLHCAASFGVPAKRSTVLASHTSEKHIAGGAARRLNRSKAAVSCPATTAETSARASLDGSAGLAASFGSPHWSSRPSGVTRKNRIFGLAVADAVAPNGSLVSSPPALALRRCDSGASFWDRPMPPALRTPPPMTPLTPRASEGEDSYRGLPMKGAPARCGGVAPVEPKAVARGSRPPPDAVGVDPPLVSLPRLPCRLSARS